MPLIIVLCERINMKSLDELYKEIQNTDDLKKEFITAFKEGKVEEFLEAHNCGASASDVMAFLKGQWDETASEDDLAKVAGGWCSSMSCINCNSIDRLC